MNKPICVVAGAGPGMGLAIAARFAREGFEIALMARDETRLAGVAREMAQLHGVRVCAIALDLADGDAIAPAFERVRSELGDPTVLIYNAARWHESPAMSLSPDTFARDLGLSVGGALACAQQVFPAMQAAGQGSLLFTGGGLALNPQYGKGLASLTAGKSALRGLVYAMASEVADAGVHAATVTIAGTVHAGSAFDPALISQHYWALHTQARADWQVERVFDGKA
jgi:NAD(P)-dependent dehydrogenase (short-subunit alcohol dehydrogenase family)